MTNEQYKVKEYLSSLRFAETMIKIKLEKIEELESLATRINLVFENERVQGGKQKNVVEDTAIKVVSLTEQLKNEVDKYKRLQSEITYLIDELDDETQKKIIDLRYIHFMKWDDIAYKLSYDERHIRRVHLMILDKITKCDIYKNAIK